jgi:hypothetical protein
MKKTACKKSHATVPLISFFKSMFESNPDPKKIISNSQHCQLYQVTYRRNVASLESVKISELEQSDCRLPYLFNPFLTTEV